MKVWYQSTNLHGFTQYETIMLAPTAVRKPKIHSCDSFAGWCYRNTCTCIQQRWTAVQRSDVCECDHGLSQIGITTCSTEAMTAYLQGRGIQIRGQRRGKPLRSLLTQNVLSPNLNLEPLSTWQAVCENGTTLKVRLTWPRPFALVIQDCERNNLKFMRSERMTSLVVENLAIVLKQNKLDILMTSHAGVQTRTRRTYQ